MEANISFRWILWEYELSGLNISNDFFLLPPDSLADEAARIVAVETLSISESSGSL